MPKEDGYKNLKPQSERTPEERKKIAQMGAAASNRVKREKRTFKELLDLALSSKVRNKEGDEKSRKEVATIMLADKCARGDLKAIALAQSILGEEATKKIELTGKDGKDLIPAKRLTKEEAADLLKSMESEY